MFGRNEWCVTCDSSIKFCMGVGTVSSHCTRGAVRSAAGVTKSPRGSTLSKITIKVLDPEEPRHFFNACLMQRFWKWIFVFINLSYSTALWVFFFLSLSLVDILAAPKKQHFGDLIKDAKETWYSQHQTYACLTPRLKSWGSIFSGGGWSYQRVAHCTACLLEGLQHLF